MENDIDQRFGSCKNLCKCYNVPPPSTTIINLKKETWFYIKKGRALEKNKRR
jgi:hypothetical protein